jgi:hypothetical protein
MKKKEGVDTAVHYLLPYFKSFTYFLKASYICILSLLLHCLLLPPQKYLLSGDNIKQGNTFDLRQDLQAVLPVASLKGINYEFSLTCTIMG